MHRLEKTRNRNVQKLQRAILEATEAEIDWVLRAKNRIEMALSNGIEENEFIAKLLKKLVENLVSELTEKATTRRIVHHSG